MELTGSGSGLLLFSVTRLEDGLGSGPPVMSGDCAPHVLPAGEATVIPFEKSGGYSPDDPNAAFMEVYNADPLLTLSSGTWRIDVATDANIGPGCDGEQLDLDLGLVVTVTDEDGPSTRERVQMAAPGGAATDRDRYGQSIAGFWSSPSTAGAGFASAA